MFLTSRRSPQVDKSRERVASHLIAHRTVVVDVQHVDVRHHYSLELPVGGHDSQSVSVFGLPVQGLLHDQGPASFAPLDDSELAQRVPVCTNDREQSDEA